MKMITVRLNGKEVQADLLNPTIAKRFEDGFTAVLNKYNEAALCESGSEGIRKQCQAVIDYVRDIFGEEAAKTVFGDETDLLTCLDILDDMSEIYPEQVNPLIKEKTAQVKDRLNAVREDG